LLTAEGMAAEGHEVILVARQGGALATRAREAGVEVRPLRFQGDFSPAAVAGLVSLLRKRRPDIVHAHDPHALSAAFMAAGMARSGTLIAARRVDFPLRGAFSRYKYRRAQRIICSSKAIAAVLENDGIPEERIRVVYEGVRDRVPKSGDEMLLRSFGVPEGAPVVGNIAALTDHKDHRTLIEAARIVLARRGDVRFLIAGEGECRRDLERRLHETGLQDKVLLLGFRNDIDALLPAFTLFCLPSHMEGLGTSVLDAMAFGIPVVATNAGGIPEAVEDGVTGRVVPVRNAPRLAEALLELLEDEGRRTAMGFAGRRSFEERFAFERMVANTIRVYREVI
jgi:glycosyltransferase involved in cell wall biosynthesis